MNKWNRLETFRSWFVVWQTYVNFEVVKGVTHCIINSNTFYFKKDNEFYVNTITFYYNLIRLKCSALNQLQHTHTHTHTTTSTTTNNNNETAPLCHIYMSIAWLPLALIPTSLNIHSKSSSFQLLLLLLKFLQTIRCMQIDRLVVMYGYIDYFVNL